MIAGTGSAMPLWGEDSGGTDEPFTVLSPDGSATGPEVVIVSLTGFEGYQGGLGQAANGVQGEAELFTVDGRDAIYHPAGRDPRGDHWADLVVVRGNDLAVRATSPAATREELLDIVEAVDPPTDRRQAPTLSDPPGDLEVVGSLDVDAVQALSPYVSANTDQVPGGGSAHVVGWLTGAEGDDRAQLTLLTLPEDAADLDALPATAKMQFRPDLEWEPLEIDGQPAMTSFERHPDDPTWLRRAVWMESAWGDLVVVAAWGQSVPTQGELVAMAASVQPVERATWDDLVIDATGGPGLHADEGRTELARGRIGDLEWLLQDAPVDDSSDGSGAEGDDARVADPCLKLSDRSRACATGGTVGGSEFVSYTTDGDLGFAVISTTLESASVQVTSARESASAPLVRVPGSDSWVAVVFLDHPGEADGACDDGPPLVAPPAGAYASMRVDALDADGVVIGCLGFGPGSHAGGI